ncbi:hypothetical protein AUEXF2481DRAFT_27617 [Aureobasidium subglaciale EXF-2481]|uniref:Uncharacterized protein n=1 Tax=Aureobasidium subglaciale (strain EXF-2481) TaxID=1043005 RepID=A0A074ZFH5_AURSE|nr:uncharacterized protein AUEXF2481DRAFT_27617 [Aureobasidium subglaciale EXF-2481]KEQ97366.1 hypothetical protein AUEXF2481DRAFT_27617 [Aureobasidium subglaciale EXF-2481]
MQRVRMHIDFLKALVNKGGDVTSRGFPAEDMVDAIVVLCQGEYMHTRYPFTDVRIHKNHAVFAEGATSPIFKSLVQMNFTSTILQTPELGDDHMTNYPATMLHLSLDVEQGEIADDRWLGRVETWELANGLFAGRHMLVVNVNPRVDSGCGDTAMAQAASRRVDARRKLARERMITRVTIKSLTAYIDRWKVKSNDKRWDMLHDLCSGDAFMFSRGKDKIDAAIGLVTIGAGWPFDGLFLKDVFC